MESIWKKDIAKTAGDAERIPGVNGVAVNRSIIVIGGGIAGILCAYMLSESGHKVTLIEAETLLSGVTKNTTAHINALQGKYSDIPTNKKRRLYYKSQIEAVCGIEETVKKHNIDCDFKRLDSFLFGGIKSRRTLKKEYLLMKKAGAPVEYSENSESPFGNFSAIKLGEQAIFNPVRFLQGIPKNFEIIENARIKKVCLAKKTLKTEDCVFKADKIILATNFPIVNIRGLYAFKMYKSFSYAINVRSQIKLNAIFNSIEDDGLTYRDSENGIITGGLDHRTGRAKHCDKFVQLKERAAAFGTEITNKWAANDCVTFDGVPFAGKFKRLCRGVFIISGFGKWGMTNAFAAAKTVADLVSEKKNEYAGIFKPAKIYNIKVWHKILINAFYDVYNLIKSFFCVTFKTPRSLKKGQGGIVGYRFRKRAVYKDESGDLHVLASRCPHMRCQLKFNPNTKTWDCPCHGSRLTVSGQIITAPAVSSNEIERI